ncbi:MAG TPA: hypothetical protein VFM15_07290 [Gammaproteobacteria bacterium]|nr:hypothetical protein [Gammaproteobacteria bacterium]
MMSIGGLLVITGLLALLYGALILWNVAQEARELEQEAWLNSEEVRGSRFNSLANLRHLLRPERRNISFSRSKGRGYAMLGIGIVLLVFAFF